MGEYRKNIGLMVVNREGKVLVAQRDKSRRAPGAWQMPQGGMEKGESVKQAALRELYEETGITSGKILAVSKDWFYYDYPEDAQKLYGFRGQKQKWVLLLFTGEDSEIKFDANPEEVEFCAYRWVEPHEAIREAAGFKQEIYEAAFLEFSRFFN